MKLLEQNKDKTHKRFSFMKRFILVFGLLVLYLVTGNYFDIYIPCPIKELTGLYCPGCGITRMFKSLLELDFYAAFRYNPLLFIMLPFALVLYFDYVVRKDKSFYKKIPEAIWYIIIALLIVYGILRNIPYFSFLAPTSI